MVRCKRVNRDFLGLINQWCGVLHQDVWGLYTPVIIDESKYLYGMLCLLLGKGKHSCFLVFCFQNIKIYYAYKTLKNNNKDYIQRMIV